MTRPPPPLPSASWQHRGCSLMPAVPGVQARWGQKPDGVCMVVGSCCRGFHENNTTGGLMQRINSLPPQNVSAWMHCQYADLPFHSVPAGFTAVACNTSRLYRANATTVHGLAATPGHTVETQRRRPAPSSCIAFCCPPACDTMRQLVGQARSPAPKASLQLPRKDLIQIQQQPGVCACLQAM